MKAYVTTVLRQELEVPEGWAREDIFDFLAEHQSFRTAFQGEGNDQAKIIDLEVVEETVTELGETAYDD